MNYGQLENREFTHLYFAASLYIRTGDYRQRTIAFGVIWNLKKKKNTLHRRMEGRMDKEGGIEGRIKRSKKGS